MKTEERPSIPEPARGHDLFVSYSRADRERVVALTQGLAERGKRAWVDLEDIPPSAEWMGEIRSAIEAADVYLVVVSPALAGSTVCAEELEHAREAGKRIVPVLVRATDPESVPQTLTALNWIDATGAELDPALDRIVQALETDLEHTRGHTRLLVRASDWEHKGEDRSLLLRGSDLKQAEGFLVQAQGKEPAPTPVQARFIQASRQGTSRRQRAGISGVSLALVVALVLSVVAIVQRSEAIDQRTAAIEQRDLARSGDLASAALSQIPIDPELSLLLAVEAAKIRRTPRVEEALRESLKASQIVLVYDEYEADVNDIAFGPDGSWIAGASDDGTIHVFDAQSGETLQTIVVGAPETGAGRTFALAVDPKDRWIASAGEVGGIRLWDRSTGEEVGTVPLDEIVYSLSFDAEGRFLVGAGRRAHLWDPETGKELLQVNVPGGAWGASISPDGTMIATGGGDRTARIWDARTGKLLQEMKGHQGLVWAAKFSDDGKLLVTAAEDRTARVWDVATGEQLAVLPHISLIQEAEFTPNGSYVLTADSEGVGRVWSLDTGEPVTELRGHASWITYADVSPSGDRAVTASVDGTARVWRLGPGVSAVDLDRRAMTWGADYSPDGSLVVTAGTTDEADIWDAASGDLKRTLSVPRFDGAGRIELGSSWFSPDGSVVAATGISDGRDFIQLWDGATGEPIQRLDFGLRDGPLSVDFSRDGAQLVTTSLRGGTTIWSLETGEAVATHEGGECHLELPGGAQACSSSFSPDGRLVAIAAGPTVELWDPATDEILRTFEHEGGLAVRGTDIHDATFGEDGSLLLTASHDQTARLWDVETGRQLVVFDGHQGPVITAEFSPDGRFVVTASQDGTARIWSLDGTELQAYRASELVVNSAEFSPDGSRVLVSTAEGFNFAPTGVPIEKVTTGGGRIFACDVCGSFYELLELARERATRDLTPVERATYLGRT